MAVCRWIYANAKIESDRKDYFVRLCDPELEAWKGTLIELSNRLLSADKRRGEAEKQVCWFAGYISREMYLVAAGGSQQELLGISSGKYREQHCVLGYGFTGDDICLLKQEDEIFEPLKEIMREIQRTGEEKDIEAVENMKMDFSAYRINITESGQSSRTAFLHLADTAKQKGNAVYQSTEEMDSRLWKYSLRKPVMLGIISMEDARRLLRYFPDGMVTVIEDAIQKIYVPEAKNTGSLAGDVSEKNTQLPKTLKAEQNKEKQKKQGQQILKEQKRQKCAQDANVQVRKYQENKYQDQRQQELRRQKHREQVKLIKYWALWCRNHLSESQVEAVKKAIEIMKKEERWSEKENGFFRQSEYAAYMLLWHDKQKKKKEQEIYFLIESWADTMSAKKTVQLAELIEHINGMQRDSKRR